jgi:hypothetical protein
MSGIEIELIKRLKPIVENSNILLGIHKGGLCDRYVIVPSRNLNERALGIIGEITRLFLIELGVSVILSRKTERELIWVVGQK